MEKHSKVQGTYYGKNYTGEITDCRPDYSRFAGRELATVYTIKLDAPIQTPSDVRDVIVITANQKKGITRNTTIFPIK